MPFIVCKSFAGRDYTLKSGKVVRINGGCVMNEISADDFKALKDEYASVGALLDNGVLVYSESQSDSKKASDKGVDEVLETTAKKQAAKQKANESKTKMKVKGK